MQLTTTTATIMVATAATITLTTPVTFPTATTLTTSTTTITLPTTTGLSPTHRNSQRTKTIDLHSSTVPIIVTSALELPPNDLQPLLLKPTYFSTSTTFFKGLSQIVGLLLFSTFVQQLFACRTILRLWLLHRNCSLRPKNHIPILLHLCCYEIQR